MLNSPELYDGIHIPDHKIVDSDTKDAAEYKLFNWQAAQLPAKEWIAKLDEGMIIQPSKFKPKDDGKITHARENWISTHFICADADHIKGVEFYKKDVVDAYGNIINKKGDDKNPNGIESWIEPGQLSKKEPNLLIDVYAVGESISSMLKEPLHRRFRLVFLFDRPITNEDHFRHILSVLQEKYLIIDRSSRSPAQPVYGNGREGFNFHICGNILNLDDYPIPKKEKSQATFTEKTVQETLEEYLRRHNIPYKPSKDGSKLYVECPYKEGHTGGKQGPTDSYVWDDGKWSYFCSHAHCVHKRTWEAFKAGHGIQTEFKNNRKSQSFVSDPPPYSDVDIDVETEAEKALDFPAELFEITPFGLYRDAHKDRVPMSDPYAFSGLKHVIASLLGRKIYIKTDPTVYPNLFTAFIGDSSDSAKGNAFKQARKMLKDCDPNVQTLSALATPEGLINQFVTPVRKEDKETGDPYWQGGFAEGMGDTDMIDAIITAITGKESVRISGFFGEFGSLLRKSAKQNATGLLELLMQLYDAEDDVKSPTKVNPTMAKYPTFSMAAATDKRLIEGVLKDAYISGGFTNRFEWYLGKAVASKFINEPVDQKAWNRCVKIVGGLRNKFGDTPIAFSVSKEASERGQAFTDHFVKHLNSETMSETMMADSLKRTRMHVLKNSLIFAVVMNKPENTEIGVEHVDAAIKLAEFTTNCTHDIFRDFATTSNKQVEDKIINFLRRKPGQTLAVIANRTRQDVQTVEKAMESLVRHHVVLMEKGLRKNVYSVLKVDVF